MRFDVLLHELHLYKSRTAATQAIREGEALLDSARVKPSHEVAVGARITLARGTARTTLELLALPGRSLSKQAARELLREIPG
jgi:ribosome-associated heat shock protein Hsp15